MTCGLSVPSPAFISAFIEVNFAIDDTFPIIQIGLDRAIRIENATATAKLYAALFSVAIGGNKIHAILKRTSNPCAARAFLIEPVSREEQNICVVQCRDTRGFKVNRIHANEHAAASQRRIPYGHAQVAITSPT